MRIVIVDLHCNGFLLCNFDKIVNKRLPLTKHVFFLKEALAEGYEIVDYITGTQSGLWVGKKSLFLNRLEAAFVLKRNGLKKKVSCITDAAKIEDRDLVIFYSHLNDSFDLYAVPGRKYCNVNHFFSMKSAGGAWLPDILPADGFEGYICEADVLHDSPFFRKYLPTEGKKMLLMPYVAEPRFQRRKDFEERKNQALALGSVGLTFDMYRKLYGTDQLHPMRRELLDRKDENRDQIVCMIEHLKQPGIRFPADARDGKVRKFIKRFFNHFYSSANSPFRRNGKNSGYYHSDRVEQLNDYKMFVYPEEVTGLPALGFVEGMLCGCAYIGRNCPMYEKIGMTAGLHYIGYDGSYDDLIRQVRYYQQHGKELQIIAENGYCFAKEKLSAKAVFRQLIAQLDK